MFSDPRETLYLSAIRKLGDKKYIVCNFSVENQKFPKNGKHQRVFINIAMICEDIGGVETRSELKTKITYISQVDPGGWVPPAVVRSLASKEYPKFIKGFSKKLKCHVKSKKVKI